MWWSILPTVFKTGAEIYKNHKQSELLESEAEKRYFERMARGEIEYQRDVSDQQDKTWKDEFVLIVVCIPTAFFILHSINPVFWRIRHLHSLHVGVFKFQRLCDFRF